jgi:hypothetical protein
MTIDQLREMEIPSLANQEQIGGRHYINKNIQPWDYIVANELGYLDTRRRVA